MTAAVARPPEFSLKLLSTTRIRFRAVGPSIRRQDWVVEAGRWRRLAAGVGARHSCDGRPVDSLEVHGRRSTSDSTSRESLSSRQLRAATSTSCLQRVLSLPLHVCPLRRLILREYSQVQHSVASTSLGQSLESTCLYFN